MPGQDRHDDEQVYRSYNFDTALRMIKGAVGKPKRPNMSSKLSVSLSDALVAKLSQIAIETEKSISYHIEKALELYLAELADLQIAYDRLNVISIPVVSTEEIKSEPEL